MITVVQKAHASLPLGAGTITFPAPTTLGNVVVMMMCWPWYAATNFTFSDDAGNTVLSLIPRGFNGGTTVNNPATVGAEAWFAILQNPDDGSNFCRSMQTITANIGFPSGNASFWIFELSGLEQRNITSFMDAQYLTQQNNFAFGSPNDLNNSPRTIQYSPAGTTYGATDDPQSHVFSPSDPSREYFIVSCIAPTTQGGGVASISAVSAGFTLEPIQNGFACAWLVSSSGYDPVAQQMAFTNSAPAFFTAVWIALRSPVATPAPGTIRVVKATVPVGAPQAFTFRPSWKAPFILVDGQSNSTSLAPGTYSISEDSVLSWSTVVSGGDPNNIVLGSGQTITLTFTNTFASSLPVCYADGIIPSGAIDGVNTSFTLPNAPSPPGSLILESDTSVLAPGVGFDLSFVLNGAQLTLTYPPKTSLVAWYRFACGSQIPPLYKLNPDQLFDDNAFTDTPTAINSTYFTYGFVNAAKATQNPLLGFHRKRFTEIQLNVNGSGQFTVEAFPNYILKKDLSYNPYAYVVPPILLQTDPPDDIIRPLNSVGNRVYVMFQTNSVGASFDISKTILCGVMDSYAVINPNSG